MRRAKDVHEGERILIIRECIANGKKYKETADKYDINNTTLRNWVLRYEEERARDAEEAPADPEVSDGDFQFEKVLREIESDVARARKRLHMDEKPPRGRGRRKR